MKTIKVIFVFLLLHTIYCRRNKVPIRKVGIKWTEGVFNCQDVAVTYADVSKVILVKLGPKDITISGVVQIIKDFPRKLNAQALIYKKHGTGYEYFFKFTRPDVCAELHSKKINFWSNIIKEMNLTDCPIRKNNYTLSRLDLTTSSENDQFMASVLGEYKTRLEFIEEGVTVICIMLFNSVEFI